jgi:rhodanese-related sulfurtransferase
VSDSPQPEGHFRSIPLDVYREQFQPGDHTLVDVRELSEWVAGRIPGAVLIPLNSLPDNLDKIPNDKPVVVVCATGIRSLYGSEFLLQAGYPEVYNLEDGTMGWMMRGLPLER